MNKTKRKTKRLIEPFCFVLPYFEDFNFFCELWQPQSLAPQPQLLTLDFCVLTCFVLAISFSFELTFNYSLSVAKLNIPHTKNILTCWNFYLNFYLSARFKIRVLKIKNMSNRVEFFWIMSINIEIRNKRWKNGEK